MCARYASKATGACSLGTRCRAAEGLCSRSVCP